MSASSAGGPVAAQAVVKPAQARFLLLAGIATTSIIAAFWAMAVFLPMGFMPQEYAMWHTRKELIGDCRLRRVVIQGDSRAAAGFVPARIGDAVNVAFGGATPVETFYASRGILRCNAPIDRVILSISPGLFMESIYFWNRSVPFGFLSFGELEEIRKTSRRLGDTTLYPAPKLGDWDAMLDNALHAVRFPSYYTSIITKHLLIGRLRENRAAQGRTLAAEGYHGYGTATGSSDVSTESELRAFEPSTLFTEYMERLIEDYAARGTRIDFISVPLNQATVARMRPEVIEAFQRYLDRLAEKHRNFHVVGRAINTMDDAYFGDSTHLNATGAALFSDRVKAWFDHPENAAL